MSTTTRTATFEEWLDACRIEEARAEAEAEAEADAAWRGIAVYPEPPRALWPNWATCVEVSRGGYGEIAVEFTAECVRQVDGASAELSLTDLIQLERDDAHVEDALGIVEAGDISVGELVAVMCIGGGIIELPLVHLEAAAALLDDLASLAHRRGMLQ